MTSAAAGLTSFSAPLFFYWRASGDLSGSECGVPSRKDPQEIQFLKTVRVAQVSTRKPSGVVSVHSSLFMDSGQGAVPRGRLAPSAALAQGTAGFPVPGEEKEASERGGVLVDSVDMFVSPLGQGEWEGDFSLEVLTAVP